MLDWASRVSLKFTRPCSNRKSWSEVTYDCIVWFLYTMFSPRVLLLDK